MSGKVTVTSDGPKDHVKDPTLEQTELRAFLSMLDHSSGIGFGIRHDYAPPGTAVQVEHPHDDDDGFHVTQWYFDDNGKLVKVEHYEGEIG